MRQAAAVVEVQGRGLAVSAAFELLGREPPPREEPKPEPKLGENFPQPFPRSSTHHISEYLRVVDDSRREVPAELTAERAPAPYAGDKLGEVLHQLDEQNAVKLYPLLGIEACRRGQADALRLWTLARALDRQGLGIVEAGKLKYYANSIGMTPESFKRARRMATELGLMVARRYFEKKLLVLASLARVATSFGLRSLGAAPVMAPARQCASLAKFKAICLAAWHEGRCKHPAPISQAKVKQITGVPERTQRDRLRRAGVRRIANFARSKASAEDNNFVESAREYRPGAFVVNHGQHTVLAWHLPNSYSTPLKRARRGMMRKSLLRFGLLDEGGRATEKDRHWRMFWLDREKLDRAKAARQATKHAESTRAPAAFPEQYLQTAWQTGQGNRIWQLV